MIDIIELTNKVIADKAYIIDNDNFYEISTDTIHIKSDDFNDPIKLFILLHEVAHRCQVVLLKLEELDTPLLEREANDIAYQNLLRFNIPLSKRQKRILNKLISK